MDEKRGKPQAGEVERPLNPIVDEVSTVNDSNELIRKELKPFAAKMLGRQIIRRGQSVNKQFDGRQVNTKAYTLAELNIVQTSSKGFRGLLYNLELTEVERVSKANLKKSWKSTRQSINEYYSELYDTEADYIDKTTQAKEYDEISLFERTNFSFMLDRTPTRELYMGYLLVLSGEKEYFDIHMSTRDEDGEYYDDEVEGSESLRLFNDQCSSQLSKEDIDKVYKTLHMLGHIPTDEERAAEALKSRGSYGKM